MLIYVIPFILLLVVAIVLKKREASKEADTAPKKSTAARPKSKATTSKHKATLKNEPHVTEAPIPDKKQVTPLSTELKKQIQELIRDRNYFAAEAQINQALNKDSSQHELYLLLLDIHLRQKDEFAISQLFNHLRSLELEETLTQAEQKKTEYETEHTATVDTTVLQSEKPTASTPLTAQIQNTQNFDFDALIQDNISTPTSKNDNEQQASNVAADQPIEFKSFSLSPESNKQEPSATENPAQPLQFNLQDITLESTDNHAETPKPDNKSLETELKDLEFSFNLDPAPTTEAVVETVTAPVVEKSEDQPEFKFSFDLEQPSAEKATTQVEVESDAPSLSFDLESTKTDLATAHSIPQDMTETTDFVTPAQTDVHLQDPLVQSFPELGQINESTLNLDLVQQYIQLGSYEAARQLFAESSNNFSAEQQQRAEQLLNQIAS